MALSTEEYGYIIDPMVPFTDPSGTTIRNGFVKVFAAGSSTPVPTYKNYDGATNAEEIQLDNSGRTATKVIVSKGSLYKVCVYDAEHSQEAPVLTVDQVPVLGTMVHNDTANYGTFYLNSDVKLFECTAPDWPDVGEMFAEFEAGKSIVIRQSAQVGINYVEWRMVRGVNNTTSHVYALEFRSDEFQGPQVHTINTVFFASIDKTNWNTTTSSIPQQTVLLDVTPDNYRANAIRTCIQSGQEVVLSLVGTFVTTVFTVPHYMFLNDATGAEAVNNNYKMVFHSLPDSVGKYFELEYSTTDNGSTWTTYFRIRYLLKPDELAPKFTTREDWQGNAEYYQVGELVTHSTGLTQDTHLWRCKENGAYPPFDPEEWERTTMGEEVYNIHVLSLSNAGDNNSFINQAGPKLEARARAGQMIAIRISGKLYLDSGYSNLNGNLFYLVSWRASTTSQGKEMFYMSFANKNSFESAAGYVISIEHNITDSQWSVSAGRTYNNLSNNLIAKDFSTGSTYNTNDIMCKVTNGVKYLYRCKNDGVTGTWDSTKWEVTTLGELVTAILNQ